MAQRQRNKLSCPICLDLLRDPVTIPCGHTFCLSCVRSHWDAKKANPDCPQCNRAFKPRPALAKNTVLAGLVEDLKKGDVPGDGPDEAVTCDSCIETKREAVKSCLQCLVSYCQQHLRPHHQSPAFKSHKLVDVPGKLTEKGMADEGGHAAASAEDAADRQTERAEIEEGEDKALMELVQEEESIINSADKAVSDSEKIFTELIQLIRESSLNVKKQIRTKQRAEMRRVKELQKKLEQGVAFPKRRTPSLSQYIEDVTMAVREVQDGVHVALSGKLAHISLAKPDKVNLPPHAEPKTRKEFLKHSCPLTLNEHTADDWISLPTQQKARRWGADRFPSGHPDVFTDYPQVLCRESLTGRCYWEVEFSQKEGFIAVAYKDISRKGVESAFGNNNKSWALECFTEGYEFRHDSIRTPLSGPQAARMGVYLDHSAGILSFHCVSGSDMTLLHRVQTSFTQPLCAGVGIYINGAFATLGDPNN